jgi:sterol desaturase/sphingolipid hydroxylase (fatty acid hydroxylase superfamily)
MLAGVTASTPLQSIGRPPVADRDVPRNPRSAWLRASPPMFESELLDAFSRIPWTVVPAVYVPWIGVLARRSLQTTPPARAAALAAAGYAGWTLTEYVMHRHVFHYEPRSRIGQRLHWTLHGVHHDHPNDPLRLVMPPSVSVPLSALFFAGFRLALGPAAHPVGVGFWLGYLGYDMVHYHVHHRRPKTRAGRWLRELHMRHHFSDHTRGFGVSAPWWDRVFRTELRRDGRA